MKPSILIHFILFFFYFNVAGQKPNQYKYAYKLNLDVPTETTTFRIDTIKNVESFTTTLKGQVKDYKEKPIRSLTIVLKNADTTIVTETNEKGLFEIKATPSTYDLTISGVGHQTLYQPISLDKQKALIFNIQLAVQKPLDWYVVHSKQELTKQDIERIKHCIEGNKGSSKKCNVKNKYYITIEI